ncbi:unnamed protein product [Pleuronectes platessa]|uniref:Uncharacterized protein n=1 Tax=Pleuronectes platessa TaxID=8262 RepID=A0A9N7VXT0_PLEPL|nr:unnamed protein product [Pleuronectes platessa]
MKTGPGLIKTTPALQDSTIKKLTARCSIDLPRQARGWGGGLGYAEDEPNSGKDLLSVELSGGCAPAACSHRCDPARDSGAAVEVHSRRPDTQCTGASSHLLRLTPVGRGCLSSWDLATAAPSPIIAVLQTLAPGTSAFKRRDP